jgi:RNA polymerase sigma factor for flagellar operon FliA
MGCDPEKVLRFLPWARRFARICSSRLPVHLDHEDLQAAGVLGYLRAASRYQAERGASFRGYCAVRIRGAVLDELRRWDWAPRSVHQNYRRITRITLSLSHQLEREPTQRELAQALGLDDHDLAALLASAQLRQVVSLDEVAEDGKGDDLLPLTERLADPRAERPDARVRLAEDRRALMACIGGLPKSQAIVIGLHYLQGVPLRQVARLLAVTPARVSQLHHQGLARLRSAWEAALRAR